MDYEDKTLVCVECQAEFVHSADDQKRYAERGFSSDPKRCPPCREARKAAGGRSGPRHGGGGGSGGGHGGGGGYGGGGGPRPPRQMFKAVCAACGVETEVPFKPSGARPVYCRDCFRSRS